MKFRVSGFKFQVSLRTRFVLGVGVMLLPLALLGAGAFFSFQSVVAGIEAVEDEVFHEMHPLMHLQGIISGIALSPSNYLISDDPNDRESFALLSRELDEAIKETPPTIFHHEKEREFIRVAWKEWQQAQLTARALLALPRPVKDPTAVREMKRFDDQMDHIASLVDQAHTIADREVKEAAEATLAVRGKGTLFMFGIFGVGVFLVIVCGIVLARSILVPLRILTEGANHISSGRLSHRVVLDHQDEMGQLAKTFNSMAEELEKSQAALQNLSIRDGLTGLYNHRAFYAMLADELVRAQRFNRPVSLLMLDIDHFKCVNDSHGHPAGDAILKGLSELLDRQSRAIDRVFRYGGEEVTVILPETDLEAAADVAERLRAAVEAQPFDGNTCAPMRITVSIGVATFPENGTSAPELLAAADQLLFVAKRAGRNRVCTSQPDPERKTRGRC